MFGPFKSVYTKAMQTVFDEAQCVSVQAIFVEATDILDLLTLVETLWPDTHTGMPIPNDILGALALSTHHGPDYITRANCVLCCILILLIWSSVQIINVLIPAIAWTCAELSSFALSDHFVLKNIAIGHWPRSDQNPGKKFWYLRDGFHRTSKIQNDSCELQKWDDVYFLGESFALLVQPNQNLQYDCESVIWQRSSWVRSIFHLAFVTALTF